MPDIVGMVSFTLKKGVLAADFLLAHEKYNREFVSEQQGYISHKLLVDEDKYTDLVVWETMEEARKTFEATQENTIALEIMSLIDQIGSDDDIPLFSVVKNY